MTIIRRFLRAVGIIDEEETPNRVFVRSGAVRGDISALIEAGAVDVDLEFSGDGEEWLLVSPDADVETIIAGDDAGDDAGDFDFQDEGYGDDA